LGVYRPSELSIILRPGMYSIYTGAIDIHLLYPLRTKEPLSFLPMKFIRKNYGIADLSFIFCDWITGGPGHERERYQLALDINYIIIE